MWFSKFAQNLPESDIHMKKKVFHQPFLETVSDKKWSLLFYLGVQSPISLHQKSQKMAVLGAKNA